MSDVESQRSSPIDQWAASPIEFHFRLAPRFFKSRCENYLPLSGVETEIAYPFCFSTVNVTQGALRVQVAQMLPNGKMQTKFFPTVSPKSETSFTCSRLNMAIAKHCVITARLVGKDAVFKVIATNELEEEALFRTYRSFGALV